MISVDSSLHRLDFHKILEIVQNYAGSNVGRKLVSELLPATDRATSLIFQDETSHASRLISIGIEPPVSNLQGIIDAVESIGFGAIALEPFHLRSAGEALSDMKMFSERVSTSVESVTGILDDPISQIPHLDALFRMLLRITTADGELAPDASPELKRISRKIQSLRSSLAARLSAISSRLAGIGVLRDSPPSIRSGRYVLPVHSGKKVL